MSARTKNAPGITGDTGGEALTSCPTDTANGVERQDHKPKRIKRTQSEMEKLLFSVNKCLGEYEERITIRHLFYRLANDYTTIPKTEGAYRNLLAALRKWRKNGTLDPGTFLDSSRHYYGREGYQSATEALRHLATQQFRINLWQNTDRYIEVWTEKDAVTSIVLPIASEWNLKVFPCKGDPSISSLADAADTFNTARDDGKIPTVIYLGDYDEVGLDIPRKIEHTLVNTMHCPIDLRRVAVDEWQIDAFKLPTRPPKGVKRGERIDRAVEIDAMKPWDIRDCIVGAIEELVDPEEIYRMRLVEYAEQETLLEVADSLERRASR